MKNLAGNEACDTDIRTELEKARIQVVIHPYPLHNEVPTTLTGRLIKNGLDAFTFTRAWRYWVVNGNVPLNVAEELFADPLGNKDVRVAGMAGNVDPKKWAFPSSEDILAYLEENGLRESITYGELAQLCNNGEITATRFVRSYHIDSQEGLDLFVSTLRKHGLID